MRKVNSSYLKKFSILRQVVLNIINSMQMKQIWYHKDKNNSKVWVIRRYTVDLEQLHG